MDSSLPGSQVLDRTLGAWTNPSPRIWRTFWSADMIAVDLASNCGEVMRYKMDRIRTYVCNQSHNTGTFKGVPVSVSDVTEETLRVTSIRGEMQGSLYVSPMSR